MSAGLVLAVAVDPDEVSAGPLGLLVVVLMVVATIFLIKNMNTRLKRLPREFPEPQRKGAQHEGAPPVEGEPGPPA